MYYKPLSSLQTLRHPNSIPAALQPIISRGITGTAIDLTIASDDNNCNNSNGNGNEGVDQSKKHYSMLSLVLIILGNGLTDEAHDLVTPFSWNEDTYFGGLSMVAQADASIIAVASYAHVLIHGREGFALCEYVMIGYQNAQYWANAAYARIASLPRSNTSSNSSILPFETNERSHCKDIKGFWFRGGVLVTTRVNND
jgi:hypothetical protein